MAIQHPHVTDEEIVRRILAGETGQSIARHYGFTDATVTHRCVRHTGMKPRELRRAHGWPAQNIPPAMARQIVAAYLADRRVSIHQLAKQFGREPRSITAALRQAKVEIRGVREIRGVFTPDQHAEVVRLYVERKRTCQEIANLYGTTEKTVRRLLQDEGVQRRPLFGRERPDQRVGSQY